MLESEEVYRSPYQSGEFDDDDDDDFFNWETRDARGGDPLSGGMDSDDSDGDPNAQLTMDDLVLSDDGANHI